MENDKKNNRKDRLQKLFMQMSNDLRPFTEEQKTLLDKHTVLFDIVPILDLMKQSKEGMELLMKTLSVMGSMLYHITIVELENEMPDGAFEQFMKDMGETQCH